MGEQGKAGITKRATTNRKKSVKKRYREIWGQMLKEAGPD